MVLTAFGHCLSCNYSVFHSPLACLAFVARSLRRIPRSLFWILVRSVALQKEQWQIWGLKFRLGYLRVGELHYWLLLTSFGSSGSHYTKWADEQHRPAGFESRLISDLPLPFIPTLIGLRDFDLVSSLVWWEALANIGICVGWLLLIWIIWFQGAVASSQYLPYRAPKVS